MFPAEDGGFVTFYARGVQRISKDWKFTEHFPVPDFGTCQTSARTPNYVLTGYGWWVNPDNGKVFATSSLKTQCAGKIFPGYGLSYAGEGNCRCYARSGGMTSTHSINAGVPVARNQRLVRGSGLTKAARDGRATVTAETDIAVTGLAKAMLPRPSDGYKPGKISPANRDKFEFSPNHMFDDWGHQDRFSGRTTKAISVSGFSIHSDIHTHTVHGTKDGSSWAFTAGGRVVDAPVGYNGSVLFGCADGWIYSLNATSGKLNWKFLAARNETKMVTNSQVESHWPVYYIAVNGGKIYAFAGRHPDMDGGVMAWCLNAGDGSVVWESSVARRLDWGDGSEGNPLTPDRERNKVGLGAPTLSDGSFSMWGLSFNASNGALKDTRGNLYTSDDPGTIAHPDLPHVGNARHYVIDRRGNSVSSARAIRIEPGGFYLPAAAGSVKVTLHDAAGRQVAVLYSGPAHAGYTTMRLPVRIAAKGVHFLRLTAGKESVSRSLLSL
jgi:hypothetical protein